MTLTEAKAIISDYEAKHGFAPSPYGVPEEDIAEVIKGLKGEPIPEDYDWWPDMPDGSVA